MSKHNYKIGGRAKISGKWFEIAYVNIDYLSFKGDMGTMLISAVDQFIEAYEPPKPKPKPFEWVPKHYNLNQARDGMTHHESLNAWITENYGDPTERVYNGEAASEFGLKPDSDVLEWRNIVGCWICVSFYLLIKGRIWRKMPSLLTKKGDNA
jgi:hypothetical protein